MHREKYLSCTHTHTHLLSLSHRQHGVAQRVTLPNGKACHLLEGIVSLTERGRDRKRGRGRERVGWKEAERWRGGKERLRRRVRAIERARAREGKREGLVNMEK